MVEIELNFTKAFKCNKHSLQHFNLFKHKIHLQHHQLTIGLIKSVIVCRYTKSLYVSNRKSYLEVLHFSPQGNGTCPLLNQLLHIRIIVDLYPFLFNFYMASKIKRQFKKISMLLYKKANKNNTFGRLTNVFI